MTTSKSTPATGHKPTIVIKLGGSMLDKLTDDFYDSFRELLTHYRCIIVHGGGPAISRLLDRLQIKGEFIEGLRKTTAETMEAVEMALGGTVSSQITERLAGCGIQALGVKGSEAGLLTADFVNEEQLGFVGKVKDVNPSVLNHLLEGGYAPVVAPFGKTTDGRTVNINADTAAAAVARAVQAEKLLFVTDVPGILVDGRLVEGTNPEEIEQFIQEGVIYGGMIPKVQSAVEALSEWLQEVWIVSGEDRLVQDSRLKGTSIRAGRKETVS
ncbi:acetylglutamate kinase [Halobacillus litoralis]|uniref:Acetylglutamate kinase n=1 Tax=Halobacillus litoralis TaxID=45668 RepID=A0A845DS74_9BACI|nr:acetylglutamate kinase [Halobacillus litoralis]MYL20433.1 acetylglutamate kinase [Halobacillus litoralis]